MWKYLLKRFLLMIPDPPGGGRRHLLSSSASFRVTWWSCATRAIAAPCPQDILDKERARLGLDQPAVAAVHSPGSLGVVRLDFGTSMWTGAPIWEEVKLRFALSLQVAIMATLVAVAAGHPARRAGRPQAGHLGRLRGAHLLHRRPGHAVVLARHRVHPRLLIVFKWLPAHGVHAVLGGPLAEPGPAHLAGAGRRAIATRRWPPA